MNEQMWQMVYQFMIGVQNNLDAIVNQLDDIKVKLNDIEKEVENHE